MDAESKSLFCYLRGPEGIYMMPRILVNPHRQVVVREPASDVD